MAARESAVRRSKRKRRRGGDDGDGGGEGGGDEGEEVEEGPQKVCSVITLSSSPYWCRLPILDFFVSNLFFISVKISSNLWRPEGVLCARFKTLDPCGDFNLWIYIETIFSFEHSSHQIKPDRDGSGCCHNPPDNRATVIPTISILFSKHLDLVIPRAAIVGVVSHLLQLLLDPNVTLDLSVVLLLLHVLDVVSVVVIEANLTSSNNRGWAIGHWEGEID